MKKVALLAVLTLLAAPGAVAAQPSDYVLETQDYADPTLVPAFIGNGYLGARIPFDGHGYRKGPIETVAQVQGLFGTGRAYPWLPSVETRASLPVWSTLDYDDGSGSFALDQGVVERYRQSLDLRSGTLTTEIAWVSRAGRRVALRYDVLTDRARPHAALVRLRFTPDFSGRVTVVDRVDPRTGKLVRPHDRGAGAGSQFLDLTTNAPGIRATLASVLGAPQGARVQAVAAPDGGTAQAAVVDAVAGQTYEIVKAVGVAVSTDQDGAGTPHDRALAAATDEARLGFDAAKSGSDAAWDALWRADIEIPDSPALQRAVRMSLFTLFASARDDMAWAPSPGGLSSDSYMGHIFWDSETWMFPVYLAAAPAIADRVLQYRLDRVAPARALARRAGRQGVRFPWESGLSGDDVVPIPPFANALHISSDVVLAVWQYWLASGDLGWLARYYPILSGVADFWVSAATLNPDGSRSIRNTLGPDEDALARGSLGWFGVLAGVGRLVDDNAYTNGGARRALSIAAEAARRLGERADPRWIETERALRMPQPDSRGVLAEYEGYTGDAIKLADVMLLYYPWEVLASREGARENLEYYVPRGHPDGPAMTDSIHAIVASWMGAGCSAYTFTRRSVDPFIRAPYAQFSESRYWGALNFATGAAGFLQEFIYGYTGFRWREDAPWFDPSLPPQLSGFTIAALHWRGRVLRVRVGAQDTEIALLSGPDMVVDGPAGRIALRVGVPARLRTRPLGGAAAVGPGSVPGSAPESANVALCRPATDAVRGPDPAANDGLVATTWTALQPDRQLVIDLGREATLGLITITRPAVTTVPIYSRFGPLFTRSDVRPTAPAVSAQIEASDDAMTWAVIGRTAANGAADSLDAAGRRARYLRIAAPDASPERPLTIGEISVASQPP